MSVNAHREGAAQALASVPEAVRPPPGNPRFPLFDGLRAIAAIAILVNHAGFFYSITGTFGRWEVNLNLGVSTFFVISGFLLYRPFVAAQTKGGTGPHLSRFYRRRVLRIVPAYWVALTVLSIWPLSKLMFDDWPTYYFFLQVYSPHTGLGLDQAWSLCVEVAYYLVLPGYAWIAGRVFVNATPTRRVRTELCALVVLGLLSAVVRYLTLHGHTNPVLVGLPAYAMWFVLGMALALVSTWSQQTGAVPGALRFVADRPGWAWGAALVLFVVLGSLITVPPGGFLFTPGDEMARWLLEGIIAFLLVVPAVFSRPGVGLPGKLLASRVMAWLGLISYGIFLWQFGPLEVITRNNWVAHPETAIGFVLTALLALTLTVPLAALSYYAVERPFLRLKERGPGARARRGADASGR